MRPWLNWIEQQISNLWVAGSSPAGRASNKQHHDYSGVFFIYHMVSIGIDTFGKYRPTKNRPFGRFLTIFYFLSFLHLPWLFLFQHFLYQPRHDGHQQSFAFLSLQ